jgi:hypothetical protein
LGIECAAATATVSPADVGQCSGRPTQQPGASGIACSFVGGPYDGAVITEDEIRAKCWFATGALLLLPPANLWDVWSRERFAGGRVVPKRSSFYRRDTTTNQPTYRFVRRPEVIGTTG